MSEGEEGYLAANTFSAAFRHIDPEISVTKTEMTEVGVMAA